MLTGTVKAKPYTYSTFFESLCLGADTATGDFTTDLVLYDEDPNGYFTVSIPSATIDLLSSELYIS